jgi:hypothetical protein
MAQQLSLDTTFSAMRHSTMTRPGTKGRQQTRTDAQRSDAHEVDPADTALSGQARRAPHQSDKLRLVGLAGVARARQALAEAAKRVEQRQLHEAA